MSISRTFLVLFPITLISLLGPVPGRTEEVHLKKIQCHVQREGVLVRIVLSRAAEFSEGLLSDPERLYLDFANTQIDDGVDRHQEVDSDLVSAVRTAQFSQDPLAARVVIDLKQSLEHHVRATANNRIILVQLGDVDYSREEIERPANPLQVTQITIEDGREQASQVTIVTSGRANYQNFFLVNPLRVVVDIADADLAGTVPRIPRGHPLLENIRASQYALDTVRVVFDLKEPVGHFVRRQRNPDRLLIEFRKGATVGKVVVVDAGHGGKDPGTSGYKAGLWEKDVVLDIAQRVAELLNEAGLRPMLTRSEDRFVELSGRVNFANARGADLFVSIHCNAMPTSKRGTRCGIEVYYYTPQSEVLAQVMQNALVRAEGRPSNGVRQRRFYVVRHTVMPAILAEVGYLDHPTEGALLNTPDFRQKVAQGIVNGIQQYLQSRPGTLG